MATTLTIPTDLEVYGDSADPTVEGDIKNVYGGTTTPLNTCDDDTGWAAYGTLRVNAILHAPLVGETLHGDSSAETCEVVYVDGLYIYVTSISGSFEHGENIHDPAHNVVGVHSSGPLTATLSLDGLEVKEGTGSIKVVTYNYDDNIAGPILGDGFILFEYTKPAGSFNLTDDDTIFGWVYAANGNKSGNWRFLMGETNWNDQTSGDLGDPAGATWTQYGWDISAIANADKDVLIKVCAKVKVTLYDYHPGGIFSIPNTTVVRIDNLYSMEGDPADVDKVKGVLGGDVVTIYPQVSDEVYGIAWDGITDVAPSMNALYDKISTLGGGITQEDVEDYCGAMFSGNTETRCTVTYQDGDGTIDVVVDNPFDAFTERGSLIASSAADAGAELLHGNAGEVLISGGHGADPSWAASSDVGPTDEEICDLVGGMFSGNTETRCTVTYQDGDNTIDVVVDNPFDGFTELGSVLISSGADAGCELLHGNAGEFLRSAGHAANPAWAAQSVDITKALLTEQGDVIYASGVATPAALPHGTAGQVLKTGGDAANPSWTSITTERGDVIVGNATPVMAPLAHGANAGMVLQTGGHGADPSWTNIVTERGDVLYGDATPIMAALAHGANAGMVLQTGGHAADPSWTNIVTERGDIIYGDATPKMAVLHHGTSGQFLKTNGDAADPSWGDQSADITKATLVAKGDLVTASAAATPAVITDVAAGQVLVSGGVGELPAYSAITTERGDIMVGNATPVIAPLAHGATAGMLLQTGGHGADPSWTGVATERGDVFYGNATPAIAPLAHGANAGMLLKTGGHGADPSWDAITTERGDIMVGNATPVVAPLAHGANAGMVLKTGGHGADPSWTNIVTERGDIIYGDATPKMAPLAHGTAGQRLRTGGDGADPAWADTVSDTAYAAGWDGVTDVAPSKNAVYDKIELLVAAGVISHTHSQEFVADGNFTGEAGVTLVWVTMVGAGGGGGGGGGGAAATYHGGGAGGGGGGECLYRIPVTITSQEVVAVIAGTKGTAGSAGAYPKGAGGVGGNGEASSFAAAGGTITAAGGIGGGVASAATDAAHGTYGVGGAGGGVKCGAGGGAVSGGPGFEGTQYTSGSGGSGGGSGTAGGGSATTGKGGANQRFDGGIGGAGGFANGGGGGATFYGVGGVGGAGHTTPGTAGSVPASGKGGGGGGGGGGKEGAGGSGGAGATGADGYVLVEWVA